MSTTAAARVGAYALVASRVVFGLRFLVQPQAAGPSWVGRRAARRPATRLFVRALGARDLALALGALRALRATDPAESSRWMLAHTLADGADLAATLVAHDDLPGEPARFALAMAAASTAIGAGSALGLRSET